MYIPATLFQVVLNREYTLNSYPSQVTVFMFLNSSTNAETQAPT